jgi:PKD repeat protein
LSKPITTTEYFVNLTSNEGCSAAIDTIKIIINPKTVNAGSDIIRICGDSVMFQPTSNYIDTTDKGLTWRWTPATGLSSTNTRNPTAKPNFTTNYILNLSSADGCATAADTVKVIVNQANFNLAFIVNQTLFTAPPFIAQFTNNTPEFNNYNYTWDFGDGKNLKSNNPSVFHTFDFNGLYSVKLIATHKTNLCLDTLLKSDYIFCSGGPTGMDEVSEKNNFNIYPNPANDKMTIKSTNQKLNGSNIIIYDLIGRKVLEESVINPTSEFTLSLNELKPGTYFLFIQNEANTNWMKFVKE